MKNRRRIVLYSMIGCVLLIACKHGRREPADPLFQVLPGKQTGIKFSNKLAYSQTFNLFKYIYFYNGSGVGAGDFNNDGLTDLFFGSNQGNNALYLNKGGMKFSDVSREAAVPADGGWTTGISVVDINNDGLLDLYVCRVGQYEVLHSRNQLLVNQGIGKDGVPTFTDQAAKYGLDFSGFSTHAAFLDYDLDGDLDMMLLNHSVHENGTFRPRKDFLGTYHPLSGDRIYRNDDSTFTDVTRETAINSSAISYGLGIAVSDIDLDGYPDVYIGNDFHENDYLYINQRNGTFLDKGEEQMRHTSQYSMGVDVADVNNDAWPEIISMDMLPADPYILKRSLGEDAYDIFNFKLGVGYSHQYTRNNLQYNRRNGHFSETGLYSGIAATDWSWAPLWFDFDNDGLKDLFISNGIPKRMNDIDYINFVSNSEIQQRINGNNVQEKDLALINKFPEIKLPNKIYRNNGGLAFTDERERIAGQENSFSNGSVYADLDNDGDLDVVVNNIDAEPMIYENLHHDSAMASLTLKLTGPVRNRFAVGSKIIVYAGNSVRTYEKYPVRGFMSSMETGMLIGTGGNIDSMTLIWPDNTCQTLNIRDGHHQEVRYKAGLRGFDYAALRARYDSPLRPMEDMTASTGIQFKHAENRFVEFDREPLIPHMLSTEGPALAHGDLNNDGLDDVYLGAARDQVSQVYLQTPGGTFTSIPQPALEADKSMEDVDACMTDMNGDGFQDIVVASGGNEFYGSDIHNAPRVYLGDGKGNLSRLQNAFGDLLMTASCVVPQDVNGDGRMDLFIGGRTVPWEYGSIPRSYLLLNDGRGFFRDATDQYAPGLQTAGLCTSARWSDLNKDGREDLLLTYEWGGLDAFVYHNGKYTREVLTDRKGWWNFLLPVDLDLDGDVDLVAGNLGLNSRIRASLEQPVRMYYNDYDDNGKKEQVLTYYLEDREIPFANKAELEKQIPALKKKFLYAEDFAKASLAQLFGQEKLDKAAVTSADHFANSVLINNGKGSFTMQDLPMEAQLSPFRDAVIVDANGDRLPDILLMGNYYDSNIQMGRYDADMGTILVNQGGNRFMAGSINGLQIDGQVRHIREMKIGTVNAYVLARNNDSLQVIRFR